MPVFYFYTVWHILFAVTKSYSSNLSFIPSILKSLNLKAHILYIFNYILKQQLIVWTLAAVA